jgi:flagellar FliJ protein
VSEKRFVFGLERVRELRVHAEDRAKEELAQALAARLRNEAVLSAADARLARSLADARPTGQAPLSGPALAARQAWTERLERSRADAERALHRSDADVVAQRTVLGAAARDRQALEKLRGRRLAEHRAAAARREGAVLDELAARTHARGAGRPLEAA